MNLKLLSIVLIFILFKESYSQTFPLSGHPRLFFLSSDEAALKEKINNTTELKKVHELIISESNKIIPLPVQQRILTGKRLLTVSREAIRRIAFLSYSYRMTGETKYAIRAETEMLAMASFSDWNPSHFLDVGEMTLALAIGYDWCYNYLTPSSRSTIALAIKNKGIEETTGSKANQSWMTSDNNWNQVCNGGISAGVAAVYDENPAYYQPLIDRAVNSIKIPMEVYKFNGAYPEGMSYWEYGTTFNILFIDMLRRMWNTDRDLLKAEGFLNTVNFVTHMHGNGTRQMSGGTLKAINPQVFNFADGGSGSAVLPGMFWLAERSGNQSILYNEMQKLVFSLAGNESGLTGNRMLPFLLIWSINLNLNNLPAPTDVSYIAQGKSAVVALRSGWGPGDIFLAAKGGTPSSNHAHMDIGSFVMDAMDVRWAMDFGSSDYNTLETNGVDLWNMNQNSERWNVFRYNNMAHNTLTFNNNKQLVLGNATIDNVMVTPDLKSAEINLTPLYSGDVSTCKRTFSLVSNRYAEVKDEIRAGSKNLVVRWNLLTQAVPQKVSDNIIKLTQSTKTLYLVFEGPGNVVAKAWSTKPPTPYEEQNSDTYFAGFEFSMAANASQTVTVKLVPSGDPVLNGLNLTSNGIELNETFESFSTGSLFGGFVNWKMNPASNGTMKALQGEVIENPYKAGINMSNKVLKIKRQDDSEYITSANASQVTYRGVQAYGYDLRLNPNSIIEFKYYKNTSGNVGVRVYDGLGNYVLVDFTDPYEQTVNYSTAQWRSAQFAVGAKDLSKFNYTASGYLLISPERNGTETFQEKELIMYVDEVKLLPLSATVVQRMSKTKDFSAFYDLQSNRVCVINLPEDSGIVRLFDYLGRKISETQVSGTMAMLQCGTNHSSVYIVQVLNNKGGSKSLKVVKNGAY